MNVPKVWYFCLIVLLSGCQTSFDVPLKTDEEVIDLISLAKVSAEKKQYQQAIRYLERLINECVRDSDLDKQVSLMIAQYYYKLGSKKKANFAKGVAACDALIIGYPDFAVENDVYLLKIKFYLDNLDQTAKASIENAGSIISFVDEYTQLCNSKPSLKGFFAKNEKEIKDIRLKCLELQVKKKLELGKIYIEDGHLIPALDSLTEVIQASKNNNIGTAFAKEAADLICGLGNMMNDDKGSFFDKEEKEYWESQRGDFRKDEHFQSKSARNKNPSKRIARPKIQMSRTKNIKK